MYVAAVVLLVLGAIGIFNLFAAQEALIGGKITAEVLLWLGPGLLASAALAVWAGHLAKADASGDDLKVLSKRFGWAALFLIFLVPIVAMVGVSATMHPEAGWVYIFVPSYVSFSVGVAVLIFSGVLSHIANRPKSPPNSRTLNTHR